MYRHYCFGVVPREIIWNYVVIKLDGAKQNFEKIARLKTLVPSFEKIARSHYFSTKQSAKKIVKLFLNNIVSLLKKRLACLKVF